MILEVFKLLSFQSRFHRIYQWVVRCRRSYKDQLRCCIEKEVILSI